MSKKLISIVDVKDYVGQEVTIGAWVANKSGKGKIAFVQLRDGSAFFKVSLLNQTSLKNMVKNQVLKNLTLLNVSIKKHLFM